LADDDGGVKFDLLEVLLLLFVKVDGMTSFLFVVAFGDVEEEKVLLDLELFTTTLFFFFDDDEKVDGITTFFLLADLSGGPLENEEDVGDLDLEEEEEPNFDPSFDTFPPTTTFFLTANFAVNFDTLPCLLDALGEVEFVGDDESPNIAIRSFTLIALLYYFMRFYEGK